MQQQLSIVVPVYNAGSFLRSIDFILNQSYKDFELILVDDGSTDESGTVCDQYASQDHRVKVIHKRNAGASEARNTGIDSSICELITFIDADDSISKDYLEVLMADYQKADNPDFVIQGMLQKWSDHDTIFKIDDGVYQMQTSDGIKFFENVKINDFSGPYCKLYRRSILDAHNIRFSKNIIYAEDLDFMLRYLMHCKTVIASSATNYFYMMHIDSVSSKIYDFDRELSGLRQLYGSFEDIVNRFPNDILKANCDESINAYIWRVIYSNYRYGYSRHQRISNLKKIDLKLSAFFSCNYKAITLLTKTVKYMMSHRLFTLMDYILTPRLTN